jgi:DNA gyrase subunit A
MLSEFLTFHQWGELQKGRSIANILELKEGEKVAALMCIPSESGPNREDITWKQPYFVFFATKNGIVKKTMLEEFANIRKDGIIAINIEPEDKLIGVQRTSGTDEIILITKNGQSIRFSENDVRHTGRNTIGVKGIELEENDAVVALSVVVPGSTLLVVGENGIGKRTDFKEYRLQSRGGKGVITMKTTDKTGVVVGALPVKDDDEVMLITEKGKMVRIPVKDVRETGRATQGVKLIELAEEDKLQAIAPVINEDKDEENQEPVS